jgi:hypothetical protein
MNNITFDSGRALSVLGVNGRLTHRTVKPGQKPGLWFNQKWISETRIVSGYGPGASMRAELRFDDNCGNGHNTFAITGDIRGKRGEEIAGGCLHDDIAQVFPEFAHLVAWHLCSTDGPMHYVANSLYLAGDADYNGRRKGDASRFEYGFRFSDSPITNRVSDRFYKWIGERLAQNAGEFRVVGIAHEREPKTYGVHYTLAGFGERWQDCPFSDETKAQEFAQALNTCTVTPVRIATAWSEGKTRELESARRVAVWPDATDAELSMPRDILKAALESRLPALLARFKADMLALGFHWAPEEFEGLTDE